MNLKAHWEQAYASRPPEQPGWYRAHLECSLALSAAAGLCGDQPLIDVGGGASTLLDDLLALGAALRNAVSTADSNAPADQHINGCGPRAALEKECRRLPG
ncbi:MAG: hypothetical protein MUE48_02015 [Desulfobacterales bacterium]|nr:hypothetical protein [Desulfobacterales bacterium]